MQLSKELKDFNLQQLKSIETGSNQVRNTIEAFIKKFEMIKNQKDSITHSLLSKK